MALIPIFRQPVQMASFDERDYACDDPTPFCSLYKQGTPMRVQMKQSRCGFDLMCNPDFGYGGELLTNGTFAGSASGWTLAGGWSYSSNTIVHTGGASNATQSIGTMVSGKQYQCTIVILSVASEVLVSAGGGSSVQLTSAGTFTFNLVSGGSSTDIVIGNSNAFDATIDSISIKEVECWVLDSGVTINNGVACHTPGTADDLYAEIYSLTPGDYVTLTYSVFGMSAGQIEVYVGGTLSRTVTENGTYTDYVYTAVTDIKLVFSFDSDCDACISPSTSYRLNSASEFSASLVDSAGNTIASLPITLIEDRVNVVADTTVLTDDCYFIRIVDPCGLSLGSLTQINSDPTFDLDNSDPGSPWTAYNDNGIVTVSTGELKDFIAETTPLITQSADWMHQAFAFTPGYYAIKVTLLTGLDWEPGMILNLVLPTGATATLYPIAPDNASLQTTYTTYIFVNILNPVVSTYEGINIHDGFAFSFVAYKADGFSDAIWIVDSCLIEITTIDPDLVPSLYWESKCLQVKADVGDALLVRGDSDADHSLGFVFDSNFPYLETWLFNHFTNPRSQIEQGNYLYSSGTKYKTFAQLEKVYDLQFEAVNENMHDTIAAILCMDHVYMGITSALFREYIWLEKSYEPIWAKKTATGTAESVVEIARISDTVFK